jgi:hypothetical protein
MNILSILDNPIVNSFLVFLITSLLLYTIKPKFMFTKDGKMKQFGYGKNKTCFTFPVTVFGITLISFVFFKVLSSSDDTEPKNMSGGSHRRSHNKSRRSSPRWFYRGSHSKSHSRD